MEESENESSSSTSSVAVAKQSARSVLKKGASELETLKGDAAKIKEKIAAAKEKNAAKVQEHIGR